MNSSTLKVFLCYFLFTELYCVLGFINKAYRNVPSIVLHRNEYDEDNKKCFLMMAQHQTKTNENRNNRIRTPPKNKGEKTVCIIYHKPKNVVTSHATQDEKGRLNVYNDIESMRGGPAPSISNNNKKNKQITFSEITGIHKSKLSAIGRLDAETTGALLLTNDGLLLHAISNPNANVVIDRTNHDNDRKRLDNSDTKTKIQKITKTYTALIMGKHCDDEHVIGNDDNSSKNIFDRIRQGGIQIGKTKSGQPIVTQPVSSVFPINENNNTIFGSYNNKTQTLLQITLTEGKNRQIRKMFHALGSGVLKLHRNSIGNIIPPEKEGHWRVLTEEELFEHFSWKIRSFDVGDDEGRKGEKGKINFNRKRRKVNRRR